MAKWRGGKHLGTILMLLVAHQDHLGVYFRVLVEKKNKKRTKESEGEATEKQNLSASEKGKKQTETKPSQVRTFPNGLIIEDELFMGKPDGKKAAPGKKVSVKYIGKLQKDGGKYLTQMWESTL